MSRPAVSHPLWLCLSFPRLATELRQPPERALKALAAWAEQFSAEVCLDPARGLIWIEVGASRRYFRGFGKIQDRIRAELAMLGYTATMALAPTLEGAALLAAPGRSSPLLSLAELRSAIASQPLSALTLEAAVVEGLRASGIQSIAELLNLPMDSLARRFGPQLPAYLRRITGEAPDPRPRFRSPATYRRCYDCPYPIATAEALLFPLRRILYELQGYLRAKDTAVQALTVTLRHPDAGDTPLLLRLSTPQRDAPQFFAVLKETLERTSLADSVTGIVVTADAFVAPQIFQIDLFDAAAKWEAGWSELLDKIRARLGDQAIRQLGLADDLRPERAWCVNPGRHEASADPSLNRPLWLIEPTPLEAIPTLIGHPERIEAGWWEGQDVSRDYYCAQTTEGARLWVYQDRATRRWFLQGFWG